MDPNKALQDARQACERLCMLGDGDGPEYHQTVMDALEAYRALDEWVSRGGFFPDAWLVKR